jgi:ABC-type branched-subunit amino acid transport system substrate-binding protein
MKSSARKIAAALLCLCAACEGQKTDPAPGAASAVADPNAAAPALGGTAPALRGGALKTDHGVDLTTKTIKLGVLNDESGSAAAIGKPYAVGKRVLAAQINAGGSGLLPEGWKVELVERDHGYNPHKAVQVYNQIKDDVLLIAHSFGTPNTLPLRPMLERDGMIALPGSLASAMSSNRFTVPNQPSYEVEAMRAFDWVVGEQEKAGKNKDAIRAAIVYQQDDYGHDGLKGWLRAAEHHGIALVSKQPVIVGQRDFAPTLAALKEAKATHVMLSILPGATEALLGAAAQLAYRPTWLGQSPSWSDGFFDPQAVRPALFASYYWVTGGTYWGENLPGMVKFLEAYEKHGASQSAPNYYLLASYAQGVLAVEIARRAIEAGDATRAGLLAQLPTINGFDSHGLTQPIDLSTFPPYVTSTRTRVMKPDFAKKVWTTVGEFASPLALDGA